MSGSLSKRQQARNERALQELIKTVPGNNMCADCQARNPGWASWSLGIFLCMRCATLHRKLGTHISKVKSLSMDSWSTEQVENMKSMGNIASNQEYNPQNTKPPIPFDADEVDAAMERFIRQKYQGNSMRGGRARAPVRHDTGTTGSTESDDTPPPLPPKTGSKFGFRSASSIFPMSSKAKREAAARAHLESEKEQRRSPPLPMKNKASRVFGTAVGSKASHMEDIESKLAMLCQMGFMDEKRNVAVLEGQEGNLEKTVESLVKLSGESYPPSRSRTPLSAAAGISIQHTRETESPKASNNPFDLPSPTAPPLSSQSTGTLAHSKAQGLHRVNGNQYHGLNGSNPFGLTPSQSQSHLHQQYILDQSFQNMSLGQTQLFPNHTGGFPTMQPYQAAGAGPMPTIPQHYTPNIFDNQPQQQQPAQPSQNYNPFQQQASQAQAFNRVFNNTSPSNPFLLQPRAQTFPQQASYGQSQNKQTYVDPNQHIRQYQHPQLLQHNNPFGVQTQQSQEYPQSFGQYMQFQSQLQQLPPQQTTRADKSSILALYNYPQLAPMAPTQTQSPVEAKQNPDPSLQGFSNTGVPNQQQQMAVSSPLVTYATPSKNPFLNGGGGFSQGAIGNTSQAAGGVNGMNGAGQGQMRHISQESMSLDVGGWHGRNGRHSPDAFASLSARSIS